MVIRIDNLNRKLFRQRPQSKSFPADWGIDSLLKDEDVAGTKGDRETVIHETRGINMDGLEWKIPNKMDDNWGSPILGKPHIFEE